MEIIGLTLDTIGKIMVSYTAISVHYRVWKEHKIDERVFAEMKKERFAGLAGILLMVVGYVLQLPAKL